VFPSLLDETPLVWSSGGPADVAVQEVLRLEEALSDETTIVVDINDVDRAIAVVRQLHVAYLRLALATEAESDVTGTALRNLYLTHLARMASLADDVAQALQKHEQQTWLTDTELAKLGRRGITETEMAKDATASFVNHYRLPVESGNPVASGFVGGRVRLPGTSLDRLRRMEHEVRRLARDSPPYPSGERFDFVIKEFRALAITNTDVVSEARREAQKIAEGRKANVFEEHDLPEETSAPKKKTASMPVKVVRGRGPPKVVLYSKVPTQPPKPTTTTTMKQ